MALQNDPAVWQNAPVDEPGVYTLDECPSKPHPHCYCYLTAADIPTLEELEQALADGEFDTPDNKFSQDPSFNTRLRPPSEAFSPTRKSYKEADYDSGDLPDVFDEDDPPEHAVYYGGGGYSEMNKYLRTGRKVDREVRDMISDLEQDLRRGVTASDLTVHRGMSEGGLAGIFGLERDWSNRGEYDFEGLVGKVMVEKGFMSTYAEGDGLNRDSSFVNLADVTFDIQLPSGTMGSKLPGISGENEFLLPPGSEMVIGDVVRGDGKVRISMILTGQGAGR